MVLVNSRLYHILQVLNYSTRQLLVFSSLQDHAVGFIVCQVYKETDDKQLKEPLTIMPYYQKNTLPTGQSQPWYRSVETCWHQNGASFWNRATWTPWLLSFSSASLSYALQLLLPSFHVAARRTARHAAVSQVMLRQLIQFKMNSPGIWTTKWTLNELDLFAFLWNRNISPTWKLWKVGFLERDNARF